MKEMIQEVANQLPPFNDFVIRRFTEQSFEQLANLLDSHFKKVMCNMELQYVSHRTLNPLEAMDWQLNHAPYRKKNIDVSRTTYTVEAFDFDLHGDKFTAYIQLPFLEHHAVFIAGSRYYPQIMISEKIIQPMRSTVTIKAAVLVMKFFRHERRTIRSVDGRSFHQFLVQAKIHWSKKSRNTPPLLLYHLVEHGFTEAFCRYGFNHEHISVVENEEVAPGYTLFRISPKILIKASDVMLQSVRGLRLVIALHQVLRSWTGYEVDDVYNRNTSLYKIILGKMIHQANSAIQFCKFADNHLSAYTLMFDDSLQRAINKMGYPCNNMSDLFYCIEANIDKWLMQKPNDLFNMRLAMTEKFAELLIKAISGARFTLIETSRNGLTYETAKAFVKRLSMISLLWARDFCRSEPCIVNGNWMMSIGIKSRRVFGDEIGKRGQRKKVGKLPKVMCRSHPSWPVVDSSVALPSSNPIIVGTINPYLQVDDDGDIIVPEWFNEIADLFQ